MKKVLSVFMDPSRAAGQSSPEQIAEIVYEAATDDKDKLTYVAGADATAMYKERLAVGIETFRRAIGKMFIG